MKLGDFALGQTFRGQGSSFGGRRFVLIEKNATNTCWLLESVDDPKGTPIMRLQVTEQDGKIIYTRLADKP